MLGAPIEEAGPSNPYTVDTTVPTFTITCSTDGIISTGPCSFTINYVDAAEISLSKDDIELLKTGTVEVGNVSITGTGSNRIVTLTNISGNGNVRLKISESTASDIFGNQAKAYEMSEELAFTVVNNPDPITPILPDIPTGFLIIASDTKNIVEWTTVSDLSYNLYWAQSSFSDITTASKLPAVTSPYAHSGLNNGTEYFYMLTAVNQDGESSPSAILSAIPHEEPTIVISEPSMLLASFSVVIFNVVYNGMSSVNLDSDDIILNTTGNASASSVVIDGSGNEKQIILSGLTGNGTIAVSIATGSAITMTGQQADAAGPATSFTVDTTPPPFTITRTSGDQIASDSCSFNVTYTDATAITLNSSDIETILTGSVAVGNTAVSGTGNQRTVTLSNITGDGTLRIKVLSFSAADLIGNMSGELVIPAEEAYTIDNTP